MQVNHRLEAAMMVKEQRLLQSVSFVKKGIPSIFLVSGFDAGKDDGLEQFHEWMRSTYHSPADDMSQSFDFEAGADFARLNLRVATDVANAEERPRWNAGDFFGERFGN